MALMSASRLSLLGEMAGGVANEINNSLTIISGNAQQLLNSVQFANLDSEKVRFHVHRISTNVDRIAKIIKGLCSISSRLFSRQRMLARVPAWDLVFLKV
jgi:C4-dicarboxylate-specific signal transduction histidine kinase